MADGPRIELDALTALTVLAHAASDDTISDADFRASARETLSTFRLGLADEVDFTIEAEHMTVHGGPTVYLLRPRTDRARAWVQENLASDATWFGGAVAVEHRYIHDIRMGIVEDGMTVKEVELG